jgi:membrane-associated phospholipid phosphatase
VEFTVAATLAMLFRDAAPRCAVAIGSSLMLVLGATTAGVLGSVGQMFAPPFVDGSLAAADKLLGLQTEDVVRIVIQFRGGPPILAMLYELATPMLFLSALTLSCLGRFERVWELCAAFSFCIFTATLTSVVFPAAGAFEHSGVAARFGAHLPSGSGVYHLRMLYSLRSASALTIDPFALRGMVTFPSFHTAMALMTAAAWRDDPYLRGPMMVWNAGVITSTIPIGGHYLVDLLGGAVTWALIQ